MIYEFYCIWSQKNDMHLQEKNKKIFLYTPKNSFGKRKTKEIKKIKKNYKKIYIWWFVMPIMTLAWKKSQKCEKNREKIYKNNEKFAKASKPILPVW